jgi:endonuclease-3
MGAENRQDRARRALAILDRLGHAMPEARLELDHQTPLQLRVSVILSAQCTDRRVNMVTPPLFKDFPTAAHDAQSSPEGLEGYLKSLGLFRSKAKNRGAMGRRLGEAHGGEVPLAREALAELAGVGNKTAGVVSMHIGGDEAFPVDTHVTRLARRMGLANGKEPDRIEAELQALLPSDKWFLGHQLLVWHGRRVCHALKPECARCVVAGLCPRKGVKATSTSPAKRKRKSLRPRPRARP